MRGRRRRRGQLEASPQLRGHHRKQKGVADTRVQRGCLPSFHTKDGDFPPPPPRTGENRFEVWPSFQPCSDRSGLLAHAKVVRFLVHATAAGPPCQLGIPAGGVSKVWIGSDLRGSGLSWSQIGKVGDIIPKTNKGNLRLKERSGDVEVGCCLEYSAYKGRQVPRPCKAGWPTFATRNRKDICEW